MINHLPIDIPVNTQQGSANSPSANRDRGGGFSEIVASVSGKEHDTGAKHAASPGKQKQMPDAPADRHRNHRSPDATVEHQSQTGQKKSSTDENGESTITSADQKAQATDDLEAGVAGGDQKTLTAEQVADVAKIAIIDSDLTAGTVGVNADSSDVALLSSDKATENKAVQPAVAQPPINGARPGAKAAATIQPVVVAEPTVKNVQLVKAVDEAALVKAEVDVPPAAARVVASNGLPVRSANAMQLPVGQQAANDNTIDQYMLQTQKKLVVQQLAETQKDLSGVVKETIEARLLAAAKGADVTDISSVRDAGALRESTALSPLSSSDLSDRLSVLKPALPGGPAEGRHMAAVQSQSINNLRFMIEQGQRAATVQLHPAELGSLKIGIDIQSEHLNVHINAAQSMTREALELLLPKMRAQLMQQGYTGVDITLTGGESQQSESQQQQAREFQGASAMNDSESGLQPDDGGVDGVVPGEGRRVGGNGLVDLFA